MPVIIISGQPGAGSSTTAKLLARKLGLKHWSAGDYMKNLGHAHGESERAVEVWHGEGAKKSFHEALDKKTVEVAKRGDVVIDGKLAIHFAKDMASFTVWLRCPHKVRVQRLALRDKIPYADADRILDEKETLERTKWLEMYGIDPLEQEDQAKFIVDTSTMPADKVVEQIVKELLRKKKIKQV